MSIPDVRAAAPTSRPADVAAPLRDRFARWRAHTRSVLIANLVGQIGIIVTGGAVRLTGSGLGCDTWPLCEPGSFTPRFHEATSIHPYVEFGNRTLTGVLAVLGIAVLLLVWTDRTRSVAYRRFGLAPLGGVLGQAIIGGVVVLLDLAPGWVALHFLVSAGLVWASTYLLYRHGEGDGAARPVVSRAVGVVGWALVAAFVPVLGFGVLVTGSGPHGGDDEVATRFPFDPLAITRIHAGAVWQYVGIVVALAVLVYRRGGEGQPAPVRVRRAVGVLMMVTLLQGAIGYVQYFTGLPEVLVGLHMLGSALLMTATTWAVLTLRLRT